MKKILFIITLILLPVSAQAADYNVYIRPHGYYVPQVNPNIQPFAQPDYSQQLTGLMQGSQQVQQQQMMMQMYQQQMYMQQQAQQRQQIMAWQKYLTEQGYDPGPIDGVWGPRSAQAYQEYMAKQNGQQAK